jgi:hypothetical protein
MNYKKDIVKSFKTELNYVPEQFKMLCTDKWYINLNVSDVGMEFYIT